MWAGVDVITLEGHILHEIIPQEKILKIKIYIIFVGQLPITADVIQSEQQIKDKETEKSKLKWKSPTKLHQLLTVSELRVVIIFPLLHQTASGLVIIKIASF